MKLTAICRFCNRGRLEGKNAGLPDSGAQRFLWRMGSKTAEFTIFQLYAMKLFLRSACMLCGYIFYPFCKEHLIEKDRMYGSKPFTRH